jgi:hypothetical protein
MILPATASDDSTQLLHYAAFASSVLLATSSGRAKACPPILAVDPFSIGGKYLTVATLTFNPDYN